MSDRIPPGEVTDTVLVRLPVDELDELTEHANALRIPVRTVLRRAALTAVRVTRAAVSVEALVTGAAAALGRDFPTWRSYQHRTRVAESVMRWLLAQVAVLPLPAPLTDRGVWVVQLHDSTVIEISAGRDEAGRDGVRIRGVPWSFTPAEWRAVAAAALAACEHSTQDREEVTPAAVPVRS